MTSRARIAKAMRKAVERLAKGSGKDYTSRWFMNEFICHAIEDANLSTNPYRYTDAAKRAKSAIHARLEGCETMEGWLINKKGVPPADITFDRMQAHRHKWLKMLIKEYETK
jgi:hypothetical protein